MSIINLTGFSFSGKSYLFDLITTNNDLKNFGKTFEFDLLRINNGLISLYNSLQDNNIVAYNNVYVTYDKYINNITKNSYVAQKLFAPGQMINKKIVNLKPSGTYLYESLADIKYNGEWPYYNNSYLDNFLSKLPFAKRNFDYFLCTKNSEEIVQIFQNYISLIFEDDTYLLSNFIDTNILKYAKFFNVPTLVVDRDPRDIYLSAKNFDGTLANAVLGNNVYDFINRFKFQRQLVTEGPNILKLNFEDIAFDTENTFRLINDFLQVNLGCDRHVKPNDSFELWHKKSNIHYLSDISIIEKELHEYI